MIDMLGDAEMSTLKEMLNGTDYKAAIDKRADKILSFYSKELGLERVFHTQNHQKRRSSVRGNPQGRRRRRRRSHHSGTERQEGVRPVHHRKSREICGEPCKSAGAGRQKAAYVRRTFTKRDAYAAVSVTTAIMVALFLLGMILQQGCISIKIKNFRHYIKGGSHEEGIDSGR